MAGSGWQGGFETTVVEMHNPQGEPIDPDEANGELVEAECETLFVSAPEPATPQQAGITDPTMIALAAHNTTRHMVRNIRCGAKPAYDEEIALYGLGAFSCGNPFIREEGSSDAEYSFGVKAYIYVSPGNFVSHRGSATEEIECAKQDFPSHYHGAWTEPSWWIDPASKCVWWGHTADGGGNYETVGKHLSPYGEWIAGENANVNVLGTALYVFATAGGSGYRVERHKTTCIDC